MKSRDSRVKALDASSAVVLRHLYRKAAWARGFRVEDLRDWSRDELIGAILHLEEGGAA